MFGLGKKRSTFGKYLDSHGIKQQELSKKSGVSEDTMTRLCTDDNYAPIRKTRIRIINALREIDPNVSSRDFWA